MASTTTSCRSAWPRPDGRGRAQTYSWPEGVRELSPEAIRETDFDAVILQRPHELEGLAEDWLGGRRPGRDLPAIYVEHNAPQGRIADMRHPAADRRSSSSCTSPTSTTCSGTRERPRRA
jgi:hypothetical protein